ncbi:MAG: polycystin cation channel protein, partial [Acidobacteria bacterium]|nr:polycystin cation channel protein [Acidobacteriota bacterium]
MIPDQRQPRLIRTPWRRGAGRGVLFAAVAFALALQACDKVALVAPSGTTITLYTNAQFLPVNASADVTASVIEANGYPVQNGTTVTFTTSLGTLQPSEAKTQDGKAIVKLMAGTVSGTAEVNAFSGSNSAKATVKVLIGTAAVGQVLLSASPPTVPSTGGVPVNIVATVQDAGGNNLSGVGVNFTTDFGTLSLDSAITDASGQARTVLTTSQSATVTATAGAKNATAKVTALAVPTVTITPPSTTPSVGVPASFTVSVELEPDRGRDDRLRRRQAGVARRAERQRDRPPHVHRLRDLHGQRHREGRQRRDGKGLGSGGGLPGRSVHPGGVGL